MLSKTVNPNIGSYKAINTDHETSGEGLDTTIIKPPEDTDDRVWVLDAIQYSYLSANDKEVGLLAAPIVGGLVVKVGDKTKLDLDIQESVGSLLLYIPGQTDKPTSVTLKAGGSKVTGKLNVQWHLEPAKQ